MTIVNNCNLNGAIFANDLPEINDKQYTLQAARRGERSAYYQFGFSYGRKLDNTIINGILYAMTKRAARFDLCDYSQFNYNRKRYSRYISLDELRDPNFASCEDIEETRHYTYIRAKAFDVKDVIVPIDEKTGKPISLYTGYLQDLYTRYEAGLRHVYSLSAAASQKHDRAVDHKIRDKNILESLLTTYMWKCGTKDMKNYIQNENNDYNVLVNRAIAKQLLSEQYRATGALVKCAITHKAVYTISDLEKFLKDNIQDAFDDSDESIKNCIAYKNEHDIVDLQFAPLESFFTKEKFDSLFNDNKNDTIYAYCFYVINIREDMSENNLDFSFLTIEEVVTKGKQKLIFTAVPVVCLRYNISNDIPAGIYLPNKLTRAGRLGLADEKSNVSIPGISKYESKEIEMYQTPRYIKTPYASDLTNMRLVVAYPNTKKTRITEKTLRNLKTSDINRMYYDFAQAFINSFEED